MRRTHAFTTTLLMLLAGPATSPRLVAQEPPLTDVLLRAAAYVADFNRELSGIVAEERYIQTWTRRKPKAPGAANPARRELLSDLMLVRPPTANDWVQYRDVFEVDHAPVRDRSERLAKLFVDPSASADAQIARIQEESARHNLGDIERNLNTPLFSLQFLSTDHQTRFAFKRLRERRAPASNQAAADTGAFRVSTEIWILQYEEVGRPTIVHTADDRDVPAKGRFWIEPATGRILMSELNVDNRGRRGAIAVSYQSEPLSGLLVPIEMREHYEDRRSGSLIDGVATYGRFRQLAEPLGQRPPATPR